LTQLFTILAVTVSKIKLLENRCLGLYHGCELWNLLNHGVIKRFADHDVLACARAPQGEKTFLALFIEVSCKCTPGKARSQFLRNFLLGR